SDTVAFAVRAAVARKARIGRADEIRIGAGENRSADAVGDPGQRAPAGKTRIANPIAANAVVARLAQTLRVFPASGPRAAACHALAALLIAKVRLEAARDPAIGRASAAAAAEHRQTSRDFGVGRKVRAFAVDGGPQGRLASLTGAVAALVAAEVVDAPPRAIGAGRALAAGREPDRVVVRGTPLAARQIVSGRTDHDGVPEHGDAAAE